MDEILQEGKTIPLTDGGEGMLQTGRKILRFAQNDRRAGSMRFTKLKSLAGDSCKARKEVLSPRMAQPYVLTYIVADIHRLVNILWIILR